MDDKTLKRFMKKVSKDKNGCWLWIGAKSGNGYAVIRVNKRNIAAHRLIYEHKFGKIPDGMESDHLCRVRNCVNPDHIELVPKLENVRRGESGKWQKNKTHCPHGHKYTPDNTMIIHNVVRGVRYNARRCKKCQADRQREYRRNLKFPRLLGIA